MNKCKVGEREQSELLSVMSPWGNTSSRDNTHHQEKQVRMTMRKVGLSVVLMASALILSGGMAYSDEPVPLPQVPADYAANHTPAAGWTDPKAIAWRAYISTGEATPLDDSGRCHAK